MVSKATSSTIFWVFGVTRPEIEPRSPGSLANTLLIRPMAQYTHNHGKLRGIKIVILKIHLILCKQILFSLIFYITLFCSFVFQFKWFVFNIITIILLSMLCLLISFFLIFFFSSYAYKVKTNVVKNKFKLWMWTQMISLTHLNLRKRLLKKCPNTPIKRVKMLQVSSQGASIKLLT